MAKKRPIICTVGVKGNTPVLIPCSSWDAERLGKYSSGATVKCDVRKPRSKTQNDTYWGILSFVLESTNLQDEYPDAEYFHDNLLIECGFVRQFKTLSGFSFLTRDSTAFDKMNDEKFGEYFKRSMALIAARVGFDPVKEYIDHMEAKAA